MKTGAGVRTILIAATATAVLTIASPAVAGAFGNLPGMSPAEKAVKAVKSEIPTSSSASSTAPQSTVETDRASAPAPREGTSTSSNAAPDARFIGTLPGNDAADGVLSDVLTPAASRPTDGLIGLLAVVVVVLFTRFLFRLNDL